MRRVGWYPGRHTSHWASWLKSEGYGIHDVAATFLAEYGGL
ncbi:SUKH-3 domain-containing protein [Actinomadura sp. CNU-125]